MESQGPYQFVGNARGAGDISQGIYLFADWEREERESRYKWVIVEP